MGSGQSRASRSPSRAVQNSVHASDSRSDDASQTPPANEPDHTRDGTQNSGREGAISQREPENQARSLPRQRTIRQFSREELESRFEAVTGDGSCHVSLAILKRACDGLAIPDSELEQLYDELSRDGGEITAEALKDGLMARPSMSQLKGVVSLLQSSRMLEAMAQHVLDRAHARSTSKLPLVAMLEDFTANDFRAVMRNAEDEIISSLVALGSNLTRKEELALEAKAFNDKFAHDSTMRVGIYADKDVFMQGIEGSLGLPGKDFEQGILLDHFHSEDSKDAFVTSNYGGTETNPAAEYEFVVAPVVGREYGGGRTPSPLRLFLLACCAKVVTADGDEARIDTPLEELQEPERAAVKTVLLRRAVEAGLAASLLRTAALAEPALQRLASMREEELAQVRRALHSAIATTTVNADTGQPAFDQVASAVAETLSGAELDALTRFTRERLRAAGLVREEVVALRLYTGPMFMKLNSKLRERDFGHKGNKYVNTIYAVVSGMVKLASTSPIPEGRTVYRGQSGMRLPERFWKENEQGVKGGVEMAFLSTTTEMRVAIDYTKHRALPTVFAIRVGAVDNGAALGWLSQYPDEQEILMPPRSFLEVVDEPTLVPTDVGPVMMIPVKINCNLMCPTLEKVVESRKSMLVSTLEHMGKEISRDVDTLLDSEEFKARTKLDIFWEEKNYRDRFITSIKGESSKVLASLVKRRAIRFNNDAEFRYAMLQVLDLQRRAMGKLALYQEATELYCCTIPPDLRDCERMAGGRLTLQLDKAREAVEGEGAEEAAARRKAVAVRLCRQRELMRESVDELVPNTQRETPIMQQAASGNVGGLHLLLDADANVDAQTSEGKTSLMMAAEGGNAEAVVELLEYGKARAELTFGGGYTAMHLASSAGQSRTVRALLKVCGKESADAKDNQGRTPMMLAAWNGHLSAVSLLVSEAQSDVNAVDNFGYTAVLLTAQNGHVDIVSYLVSQGANAKAKQETGYNGVALAAQHGHVEVIAWLVNEGKVDPDEAAEDGKTPLICAAHFKQGAAVAWLMDNTKVDLHAATPDGRTAVLWACMGGDMSIVQRLIQAGTDISASTAAGNSALHIASSGGHLAVVRFLVKDRGLAVNHADKAQNRALHFAASRGSREVVQWLVAEGGAEVHAANEAGWAAAMTAAEKGHLEVLRWLLMEGKADPSVAATDGRTVLMTAALEGHADVVQWLLQEEKADLAAADEDGWDVLDFAVQNGTVEVVQSLLDAMQVDINGMASGGPRIISAAKFGHRELVKFLVERGADAALPAEDDGCTALMLAARRGHVGVLQYLVKEAKVNPSARDFKGRTALMYAADGGQKAAAEFLLKVVKVDAAVVDARGATALMEAASGGHAELVKALISEWGFDADAVDRCGNTAAMMAAAAGHAGVLELLAGESAGRCDAENVEGWSAMRAAMGAGHEKLVEQALGWRRGAEEAAVSEGVARVRTAVEELRGRPVVTWLGPPLRSPIDAQQRTVTFLDFNTVRFARSCPEGRRAYYELTMVEECDQPQFGFVTAAFAGGAEEAEMSVGDDELSWAVDGVRCHLWNGEQTAAWAVHWKAGDVIGLACDLVERQILVSLNGSFQAPNGAVFAIGPDVQLDGGLFAAFGSDNGVVRFNFGDSAPFAFPPPSADFGPLASVTVNATASSTT